MSVSDFKHWTKEVKFSGHPAHALALYRKLQDVFVQDCAICVGEKYFGNNTKQKAKMLFELQSYFISRGDIK